ncbi:hypothetical protein KC340_g3602 [Hortaea werneckii]|nr:hypothetical protein KC342_g3940 [Hortaea werneckii]KAI7102544.1 hypothetical protein KC339_g5946 [Hortaea werneckii]KAI7243749.1 hypothetical protein KC365_g2003 [Hortaea werneckii]KAI7331898.1 hypothetical protein KC340_g3602 [Hortaea werneckii]KAI7405484.1 hypothetical protein KC328_g1384 [Hortaea werneckii]
MGPPTVTAAPMSYIYASIPPPPLPEFYMNARKPQSYVPPPSSSSSASSTTSSSDQPDNNDRAPTAVKTKTKIKTSKQSPQQKASAVAQRIVAEAQLPPAVVEDATDERKMVTFQGVSGTTPTPIITLPPPPPAYLDEVPPLAVYHICRICFRPRSSAYHRSHPIPVNAVPPPPGICRRCRILKVEETTTRAAKTDREVREIEIVRQSQSNDIRLGLFTGINDEDYISREKWEAKRARALLREAERQRLEDEAEESENERDVTYRHVRVRQRVDCPTRAEQIATNVLPCLPKPRTSIYSTAQDAIDQVSSPSEEKCVVDSKKSTDDRQRPVAYVPRATGASGQRDGLVSSQKEATSSRAVKVSTSVTRDCSSNSSHSQSTVKAKAKVETTVPKPAPTESEIRKIAREEIVRYRQAERKLQAHPDPYAHGRMVPVERRIDTKASNNDDVPWRKDTLRVQIGRTGATDQQATERPARKVQEVPVANQKAPVPKRDARVKLRNKSPWSKARSKQDEAANEREIIVERVHHRSEATKKDRRDEHVDGRDPSLAARAASHAQSTATEPRSTTSERTKWARTGHEADLDSGTSSSSSSHRKHSPQIAEWYQESTSMRAKSPLSSGPRRSNVIEVETELELPSGAKTQAAASYSRAGSSRSEMIRESHGHVEQEEVERSSYTRPAASERSSKPADRNNWEVNSEERAADIRSLASRDIHVRYGRGRAGDQDQVDGPPSFGSKHAVRTESFKSFESRPGHMEEATPTRAYDRRMAAAEAEGSRAGMAEQSTPAPENPRKGRRSPPANDYEWTHTRRIIQPADQPWKRDPFANHPGDHYTETVRYQHNSRQGPPKPKPSQTARAPVKEQDDMASREAGKGGHWDATSQSSRYEAQASASFQETSERSGQSRRHTKRREAKVSPSEGSNARVRFASKVEFSPTPPGSDASSAQFRIIGPQGRSKSKGKLSGGGWESGEDLIAEYERRGRARARDQDRGGMHASSAKVAREQQTQQGGVSGSWDGATEGENPSRDVKNAGNQPQKSRPLTEALSESPSRENLYESFSAYSSSARSKLDGYGPYRSEEIRSDSLDVGDGSSHHHHCHWEGRREEYWPEASHGDVLQ